MTFKASFFNISPALIKENLRRFWVIPVIAFLCYFLVGPFPILMGYHHINELYSFVNDCLINHHLGFLVIDLVLPVITAVIVFRYMQSSSSVTSMHAMPFTRAQLYISNLLSGIILIVTPLLANEIIFQLIAKPTYSVDMYKDFEKMTILSESAVNIFSRANVLNWFVQSLLIVLVIYAISVLAGMVTGNSIMHLVLAFGFNGLLPALYMSFISYCESYLFGFTTSGMHTQIFLSLSPLAKVVDTKGAFSLPLASSYIVFSLAILLVSWFLYKKRHLETSGDAIVFPFMIPALNYLIAYLGMTITGIYFSAGFLSPTEQDSDLYFYAGLISGAVVFFILGKMILLKTPRIFNLTTLKQFIIYGVIAALFISSIVFDVTGFEKRVPSLEKVAGVYLNSFDLWDSSNRYEREPFIGKDLSSDQEEFYQNSFYFKDEKNLELIEQLHKEMTTTKKNKDDNFNSLNFNYKTSMPMGMQRSYIINYNDIFKNKYFKQLYESNEFKSFYSFNSLKYNKLLNIKLDNIYFNSYVYQPPSSFVTEAEEISGLFNAMEQDFQNRTYEEMLSIKHPYCRITLAYTTSDKVTKNSKKTFSFEVLYSDINTINWLSDHGYASKLECSADMIEQIIFYKYDWEARREAEAATTDEPWDLTAESSVISDADYNSPSLVITDKEQIQYIIESTKNGYNDTQIDFDKFYEGKIVFKPINGISGIVSEYLYYEYSDVPDFISSYFNQIEQ